MGQNFSDNSLREGTEVYVPKLKDNEICVIFCTCVLNILIIIIIYFNNNNNNIF